MNKRAEILGISDIESESKKKWDNFVSNSS